VHFHAELRPGGIVDGMLDDQPSPFEVQPSGGPWPSWPRVKVEVGVEVEVVHWW